VTVDLTDDERQILVNMLTLEIEASRFPLSRRVEALKGILAKLRSEAAPPPAPVRPKEKPRKV
jgi:hypothetical protein